MNNKQVRVLSMIATDMKNDAEEFDGQPFNGRTVAEYLGHQGAAIATLANIMRIILESNKAEVKGNESKDSEKDLKEVSLGNYPT